MIDFRCTTLNASAGAISPVPVVPASDATVDSSSRAVCTGTAEIDRVLPQIAPERWQETVNAFGYGEQPMVGSWFYFLDNENHHRGQGYVYLRSLGIEPPPFWERAMM